MEYDKKTGEIKIKKEKCKDSKKPKGDKLIKRLINSGKTVTIDQKNNRGSSESDSNPTDATNGKGSDANVNFAPNQKGKVLALAPLFYDADDRDTPSEIILGHELIHVDRSMRGEAIDYSINDNYTYTNNGPGPHIGRAPKEELATVGIEHNNKDDITENDLRSENNGTTRLRY